MRPWIVSSASAINVSISSCTEGMSSIRPTHCPADQMPGRVCEGGGGGEEGGRSEFKRLTETNDQASESKL